MPDRAALVTGASSGIGLAIAPMLAEEGDGPTVAARRAEKLDASAAACATGAARWRRWPRTSPTRTRSAAWSRRRERWGRLDVLVDNAGVGIGALVAHAVTKRVDRQLDVNLRSVILGYRDCAELLRVAGAEHRNALVVNTSSISGKSGQARFSLYLATKAAVIGWTQAVNRELNGDGIRSVALCPGFVDTPMTRFVRDDVSPEEMIRPGDLAEGVRFLLRTSPYCVVPEIVFQRPGEIL